MSDVVGLGWVGLGHISAACSRAATGPGKIRTLRAQSLALGNLVHEVRLLLLQVGGESLGLDALHGGLDGLALSGTVGLFLLLDDLGETAVVALQGFAELGVGLALVIEVGSICYKED